MPSVLPAVSPATANPAGPDTTGYRSSGQSPPVRTVHLVGPGRVGRQFLELLAEQALRLIAVSDRSATVCDRSGLDAQALARHKAHGGALASLRAAEAIPADVAISVCAADVVVDATDSDKAATAAALARGRAALRNGAFLALCGKNALAAAATEWLLSRSRSRVGCNAVLGGAGLQLVRELDELRAQCTGVALCGNVTTTVIVQAIERGASVDEGIAEARALGILEPDPTLDLDGSDAAVKLVAVAGAVFGDPALPAPALDTVARQHVRSLDAALLRERARRGASTRLVGRADRTGSLRVAFEEVGPGSPLAAPPDRVVYTYSLGDSTRVHTGLGIGHRGTAQALLADVLAAEVRR